MLKRVSCIFIALMMAFCLSFSNFAGVVAVADDVTYLTISTSGGSLSSGTYQLTADVTIKSMLQVGSGEEVTIDLNGYEISFSGSQAILINGGTLTLKDSSSEGTGSVINTSTSSSSYGIKFSNGGTLYMEGGTVSGYYGILAKNVSGNCSMYITGGTVIATGKVAIYDLPGSSYSDIITISGTDKVVITSSGSSSEAYGIYCNSKAMLTISNPNTYVSSNAAAVYIANMLYTSVDITAGHYSSDISSYAPESTFIETDDGYVVAEEVTLPVLYGIALTLDGATGVTFYYDMTGVSEPEAYTLMATIGEDGEEKSVTAGETKTLDDGIEYYRYTVYVNPNQFNDTVSAYLTDGTNSTDAYEYSVYQYCMYSIENEENDPNESALCKAILNYGDYASAYCYETSTSSLTSVSDWTDPVQEEWAVDLSEYGDTDTSGTGKSLILGSSIIIRVYLTSDVAGESDVFTVDGKTLTVNTTDYENYSYYVEFSVPARRMIETFTVKRNGETFTTYSVLSYVKNITEKSDSSTALSDLCKAIYYYSIAANNYTGWR